MLTKPQAMMSGSVSPLPHHDSYRRLNICLVSPASCQATGGTAAYIRYLAKYLSGDCDVSGVARFVEALPQADYAQSEASVTLDNGIVKTRLIAPMPSARPLLKRLPSLMTRRPCEVLAVRVFVAAYRQAVSEAIPSSVDVIHYIGNGWEMLGYAALAEARRRGVAFTMTPFIHPGAWGDSPLDIGLYRQADAIFTMTDFECRFLVERGVAPGRLCVTGLAPASELVGDGRRFRARYSLGDRPLVLFIARKQRYKGYHDLRTAMAEVIKSVPEACLVAIGPDTEPPFPSLPEGSFLDLGEKKWSDADQQDKADALAACDVYCMPSEAESFGIVYVEAWAYGKPVVAGPAPAVSELVTDGVNGYVVRRDQTEITSVLTRLLSDSDLRRRLGAEGQKLQRRSYTWETISEAHKRRFLSLVSQQHGTINAGEPF